jgi:hypothetical protein
MLLWREPGHPVSLRDVPPMALGPIHPFSVRADHHVGLCVLFLCSYLA